MCLMQATECREESLVESCFDKPFPEPYFSCVTGIIFIQICSISLNDQSSWILVEQKLSLNEISRNLHRNTRFEGISGFNQEPSWVTGKSNISILTSRNKTVLQATVSCFRKTRLCLFAVRRRATHKVGSVDLGWSCTTN